MITLENIPGLLRVLARFTFVTFPLYFTACAQTDFTFVGSDNLILGHEAPGQDFTIHVDRVCSNGRSNSPGVFYHDEGITDRFVSVEAVRKVPKAYNVPGRAALIPIQTFDFSGLNLRTSGAKKVIRIDPAVLEEKLGDEISAYWLQLRACTEQQSDGNCTNDYNKSLSFQPSIVVPADAIPDSVILRVFSVRHGQVAGGDCEQRQSPLVLDLDGNGIKTTAAEEGVYFDLLDQGHAVQTGWITGSDDALLARDLDGNGNIDSGAELFGNFTRLPDGSRAANGFEALRVLDSDGNGMIDARDAAWNSLLLWIDANTDGRSQSSELFSLGEKGVSSISLDYLEMSEIDRHGNETKQRSQFVRTQGWKIQLRLIVDLWFRVIM